MSYEKELKLALRLARQASRLTLKFRAKKYRVQYKQGHSPVTVADRAVESLYVRGIRAEFPHDRILGEEHGNQKGKPGRFWSVDPIDGTAEFIRPGGHFSTMIALVVSGKPVLGVIAAPTSGKVYYAVRGEGAYFISGSRRRKLSVRRSAKSIHVAVFNRSVHQATQSEYVAKIRALVGPKRTVPISGAGLILCAVAEGKLDAGLIPYLNMGIWDVLPGEVIVSEAGGVVRNCLGGVYKPRWGASAVRLGVVVANKVLLTKIVSELRRGGVVKLLHQEAERRRRTIELTDKHLARRVRIV